MATVPFESASILANWATFTIAYSPKTEADSVLMSAQGRSNGVRPLPSGTVSLARQRQQIAHAQSADLATFDDQRDFIGRREFPPVSIVKAFLSAGGL